MLLINTTFMKIIVFGFLATLAITGYSKKVMSGDLNLKVTEHVLKNGLRILLHEDHSRPTLSYYSWFDVGSGHEKKGMTGIAHLFEHMMFQGTQKFGKKQYDKLIESHGGRNNAFTSNDYTAYYVNIESSELPL